MRQRKLCIVRASSGAAYQPVGRFPPSSGAAAEHCIWFTMVRVILSPIGISSVSRGELSSTVLVTRVRHDIASEWDSSGLDYRMRK